MPGAPYKDENYPWGRYARKCAEMKLATIIHTCCGWFFVMPNPKHQTDLRKYRQDVTKGTNDSHRPAWGAAQVQNFPFFFFDGQHKCRISSFSPLEGQHKCRI